MEPGSCEVDEPDVSAYPFPGSLSSMPTWEATLKSLVVVILILVAIVGNFLIIIIVGLTKKMRTTTNIYIVNLVVADILLALLPSWMFLSLELTGSWLLGAFLCKFNVFIQVNAMCAIAFTMIAIAADRFFAIVFPLKARVTQRKVKVVLAVIWICSTAVAIPPPIFYTYIERKWLDYVEKFCTDIWPMYVIDGECDQGRVSEQAYWLVVVAALNWIPMVVMTISYLVIMHRLSFGRETTICDMPAVQRRSAKRVVKLLFVLLITFIVCTVPFQVTTLYDLLKDRLSQLPDWWNQTYFCAINLMYAHSCVNPIVYGAMNQSFRAGFHDVVNRFKNNRYKLGRKFVTSGETSRPTISILNTDGFDTPQVNSLTDSVTCSSHVTVNLATEDGGQP